MFTVGAGLLTAVQSPHPVFQSIGAEKPSSAFTRSVDSGQLSGSATLAVVCQELLNPSDCPLTNKTTAAVADRHTKQSKPTLAFVSLGGNALNKAALFKLAITIKDL